jgi:hypothetical protein
MRHRAGDFLVLGQPVIPVHTPRGGIEMPRLRVETTDLIRADGTGRADLHRADRREPIQDTPHRVIMQRFRREGFAEQQFGVLLGKALLQAIPRTPTTQGIHNHAEDHRAGSHLHLGWHQRIDGLDQANLVRLGLHDGEMLDLVGLDLVWYETPTALHGGNARVVSPLVI